MTHEARDDLLSAQVELETHLLAAVQAFERLTGMVVRAVKVYPGLWHEGKPITRAIEVAAHLR
jgi:hypothetical protein